MAAELCAFFENRGFAALALQDTGAAGIDYLISQQIPLNASVEVWMTVGQYGNSSRAESGKLLHMSTRCGLGIVAPSSETIKLIPDLQRIFGSRVVYHSLPVLGIWCGCAGGV